MNVKDLYQHSKHFGYTIIYCADRGKQMFLKEVITVYDIKEQKGQLWSFVASSDSMKDVV
jgi:predicted acetyltransferase